MADFHALCVDLVRVADALDGRTPLTSNQGQALDGYSALAEFRHVAARARAALAEPEPEGPTLAELDDLCEEHCFNCEDRESLECLLSVITDALARYGNHPGSPDGSPQPVLVSERPQPKDCNADGEVWAWRRFDPEGNEDNGDHWCLAFHEWLEDEDCSFTHWLPAHALPVPADD